VAAGFCPKKNLATARKNCFADSGDPGSYAYVSILRPRVPSDEEV